MKLQENQRLDVYKRQTMTHADSNRIMLAMLEDSFNKIAEIEDSKSVDIIVKIRSK